MSQDTKMSTAHKQILSKDSQAQDALPSLSLHGSLWKTKSPLDSIPIHFHPRHTATNCGEQRVALYRSLQVCI